VASDIEMLQNKALRTEQLALETADEVKRNAVNTALLYSTVILRPRRGLAGKITACWAKLR